MIDRKNNFLPPCVLIVWLLQNIWKRQSTKVRTLQDALLFIAETRRHITLCCSVTIFFQNKFLWTSCHNCMVEIVCLCVCMSDNVIQINKSIKTFFSFVANRLLIERIYSLNDDEVLFESHKICEDTNHVIFKENYNLFHCKIIS